MVDEVVFVARSGFVGRAVGAIGLLNSDDLLRTAGKSDDAWIERLSVFLLTSGVSRSGSTVMKIGCSLVASGPSVSSAPAISISSSDRCRDKKYSQRKPAAICRDKSHRSPPFRLAL
jgi:hypothetical protein